MSDENSSASYEVGYGKPPKATRFHKGVSGNPKGRPKKAPDFDAELIREARSLITINENGRRRRISKHSAVIKQLINAAMKGTASGLRTYLAASQQAFERAALSEVREAADLARYDLDPKNLTDDQLEWLVAQQFKQMQDKTGQEEVSSTE